MGKNTDEERLIIEAFPGLVDDHHFSITSPCATNYNCIAWAYNRNDRWMWPNTGDFKFIDGVHFWPDMNIIDENVENFIEAFRLNGYEICNDCEFDPKYRKVALYVESNTKRCTHASRGLRNGFWTSKLGDRYDIQHESPYTIQGSIYGEVYCIMKMIFL